MLKLDTQPRSHLVMEVCIQQDMCTAPHPLQHGTPPPPGAMSHLLREWAGIWCHQFACLLLTIDASAEPFLTTSTN